MADPVFKQAAIEHSWARLRRGSKITIMLAPYPAKPSSSVNWVALPAGPSMNPLLPIYRKGGHVGVVW
jgi:hypothetical protein